MFRFAFVLSFFLSAICAFKIINVDFFDNLKEDENAQFKRISDMIRSENPDIITLQESHDWSIKPPVLLKKLLGTGWSAVTHCHGLYGLTVFTKHTIVNNFYAHTNHAMNVRVRHNVTGLEISVWSVFFEWSNYIHDHFSQIDASPETRSKIIANEKARVNNVVDLLKHPEFIGQIKNSDNVPVIVAGDFNAPSDLDWIDDTKDKHFGAVIDWPSSKLLRHSAGLTDSFREVNPDASANPGTTYAGAFTSGSIEERSDFIYYRGSLRPTASYTRNMTSSGHDGIKQTYAVVTQFEETQRKNENKPSFFINPQYRSHVPVSYPMCPFKLMQ